MIKVCKMCNAKFETEKAGKLYCSEECKKKARRISDAKQNERQKKLRELKRLEKEEPEKYKQYKVKEAEKAKYECMRKSTCPYGRYMSGFGHICNYLGVTGQLRGGFAGECKHYKDNIDCAMQRRNLL